MLRVRAGDQPQPFFAEYASFLWGEVNYDSEGDCARPTDQNWAYLYLRHRERDEDVEITKTVASDGGAVYEIVGSPSRSVALAARLTALRTHGSIDEVGSSGRTLATYHRLSASDLSDHIVAADSVRTMFLNPTLAPFDSHAWWGGWKWVGNFATDFTIALRATMQAVIERKADDTTIQMLIDWWNEPPAPEHRAGVLHALRVLGALPSAPSAPTP